MSYCASDTVARALVDHRHRPSVMAPRAEVHRCTLETQSVSFSSRLIEGLFSVSTKSALNWTIVPLLGLTCTGPRFGAVLIVAVVVGVISPTVDLTPVIDCRHRQKQPNNSWDYFRISDGHLCVCVCEIADKMDTKTRLDNSCVSLDLFVFIASSLGKQVELTDAAVVNDALHLSSSPRRRGKFVNAPSLFSCLLIHSFKFSVEDGNADSVQLEAIKVTLQLCRY